MSLVNDVLIDLQQRRPPTPTPTPLYDLHAVPGGRVVARPAVALRRGSVALIVILVAAAGVWALIDSGGSAATRADNVTVRSGAAGAPPAAPADPRYSVGADPSAASPAGTADPAPQAGGLPRRFMLTVATTLARPPNGPPQRAPAPARPQPAPVAAASSAAAVAPIATEPPDSVVVTPASQPARLRRDGLAALQANDPRRAETLFDRLATMSPTDAQAHLLRHQALRAQARPAAARAVLAAALDRVDEPAAVARVLGRELLADERPAQAVAVLAAHRPATGADLQYDSLLAAAYQRAGEHAAASELYTALLERRPAQGAWWVGLGISQESQGQVAAARQSFAAAARSVSLDAALADYAARRLQQLGAGS